METTTNQRSFTHQVALKRKPSPFRKSLLPLIEAAYWLTDSTAQSVFNSVEERLFNEEAEDVMRFLEYLYSGNFEGAVPEEMYMEEAYNTFFKLSKV